MRQFRGARSSRRNIFEQKYITQKRFNKMQIEKITQNNTDVARVSSDSTVICDVQSALDLMMSVKYQTGIKNIAISKTLITDKFFVLSSGLAGEILQKFIN